MNHRTIVYGLLLANLLPGSVSVCSAHERETTANNPLPPRVATISDPNATVQSVMDALARQTGLEADITGIDRSRPINASFDKLEFWKVVDAVAEQSGNRVVIGRLGKAVRLMPNPNRIKPIVSVHGPFRIAAREIEVQRDYVSGNTFYDLTLEIAWEARLPVFRMDAAPVIEQGADDAGRSITVKPVASRIAVDGVFALAKVRLNGISRSSKEIAILKGTYQITCAEEMLRCQFDDLAKFPVEITQKGVGVRVKRFAKDGSFWTTDIELNYPPNGPIFESFETYWLSRNLITLVSPAGKKITTENEEMNGNVVRYRFKEAGDFKPVSLNGWKLVYETTGAMREVTVKFELKGIPLP